LSTTNAVEAAALASIAEAEQVIDRLHAANDPLLEEHLYEAWLRKGEALAQLGRHGERAELCDALVAHADAAPADRALWIVQAFNAKGSAWRAEVYRTLIARFGDSTDAPMRERVINASEWLADAHGLLGRHEQQYTTIRDTLRRFGTQMPEAQRARLSHRLGPMTLGRFARKLIDRVKGNKH
jgi:hypothetical protein